jgi:hypothetical protein
MITTYDKVVVSGLFISCERLVRILRQGRRMNRVEGFLLLQNFDPLSRSVVSDHHGGFRWLLVNAS